MQAGLTNILDQLLGGVETKPGHPAGTTGSQGEGNAAGVMFGELLAGLLVNGQLTVDPNAAQLGSCLFPSSDQPAAQDGAPAGQPSEIQTLIDNNALPNLEAQLLALLANGAVSGANLARNAAAGSTETATATPADAKDLLSLVKALPTSQAPVYNIIDFRVVDGQVQLTAANADKPSEPVQFSVPLSIVSQALAEKLETLAASDKNQGVTANATGATKTGLNLDGLLKSSNLKSLTIGQDARSAAQDKNTQAASIKAVAVDAPATLIAEDSGARFAVTSKIDRSQTAAGLRNDQLAQEAASEEADSEQATSSSDRTTASRQAEDVELLPLRRVQTIAKNAQSSRFTLGENDGVAKSELSVAGLNSDRSAGDLSLDAQAVIKTPVRFTLPDTLQKPFASSGQTIMLKIEPQELGPARLNLTVRDQMLTARVTVETPVAKAAVERSLDQLTSQLSRAGIDVDRIDVVLDNGGQRQQFFDRRPLWSQTRSTRTVAEAEASAIDAVSTLTPALLSARYVGASGVDLLA